MTPTVPSNWGAPALEELCISVSDGDHQAPPKSVTGIPFITISSIADGKIALERASRFVPLAYKEALEPNRDPQTGDIILSVTGSIGRAAIVENATFVFQRHIALIKTASSIERKYIYYFLTSPSTGSHLEDLATGTAQKTLPLSKLRTLRVPLPPLAEQKRIVAKLDALNAKSARARTELSRIETLVSRYKQAVLSKAFSGELTRKDLRELVARIKAGKNLRCDERPPQPHEKGVVKVSAVTWGEFRADQSKTLPPDFEPDEDTRIKPGDFLFSRANTIELVGAVVIVANAPDNLYLSDKILRLEFNEPVEAWLLWYLRSPMGREALMNISSGNQLSMRNIGQKSLLSLSVPYTDAALRTEIVRRIESAFAKIDRLAVEAKRALKLLGKLDEAILAKAFRGELVPQDENDEPAEKLLERIRTEREAAPKAKRGRGNGKGLDG
ncbi:restriction endonuclease subunit S [Rhizobium sp. IY2]|uniref:restriction endonuclease subunit S n=1 Tax=Rhizobium sp. IY2 TaxID=3397853 RepID=UPI0039E01DA2